MKSTKRLIFLFICIFCLLQILSIANNGIFPIDQIQLISRNTFYSFFNNQVGRTRKSNEYLIKNPSWFYNDDSTGQYSTYLIRNGNKTWIESMVYIVHERFDIREYMCRIKVLSTNEIIDMRPNDMFSAYYAPIKKVIVHINDDRLINSQLAIAILRINKETNNFTQTFVNYQMPDLIDVIEPRRKTVGQCIPFVRKFKDVHKVYFQMQRDFGIAEIIVHDASPDQALTKYMEDAKDKLPFVTLRPYELNASLICQNSVRGLTSHDNATFIASYKEKCLKYFGQQVCRPTLEHEELSLQDCYSKHRYTYEFVAVYDLDEFVFPRTVRPIQQYNETMTTANSCRTQYECQKTPFSLGLYDYVKSILNKTKYAHDYTKFSSISFRHAITVVPSTVGNRIMDSLRALVADLDTNKSISFPFVHDVDETVSFRIGPDDLGYVNYLIQLDGQIQCLFSDMENSTSIPDELKRYMYHVFPVEWRWGKCIHYTKNVQSLFAHYGVYNLGETLDSLVAEGELLPHFRDNIQIFYSPRPNNNKLITSIRDLDIDSEYFLYMIKTFTNTCQIGTKMTS
jgi:hypothetical protein